MPDTLAIGGAHPVPVPLPALSLDGRPFLDGTVVLLVSSDRRGQPMHSTLVWHARVRGGAWPTQPVIAARDQSHLTPYLGGRVWVIAVWAGRQIGAERVTVTRADHD